MIMQLLNKLTQMSSCSLQTERNGSPIARNVQLENPLSVGNDNCNFAENDRRSTLIVIAVLLEFIKND
uniref:Uncharacterized protein n=1 Tax=Romanomermis culicivorax TaxID=13658 RepID=A0A915K5Z5_ROMCU